MSQLVLSFPKVESPPPAALETPVLGQFWGPKKERQAWFEPTGKAHSILLPFFEFGNDDSLDRWLKNRWDGRTARSSPAPIHGDRRTLGLIESLLNIPGRVHDLLKVTDAASENPASLTQVRQLADAAVNNFEHGIAAQDDNGRAHAAVARRLGDAWSAAAGKHEMHGFVENLAAVLWCMHDWVVRGSRLYVCPPFVHHLY